MNRIETTYKVELTADEIEIITTALHGEYKFIKELKCKNQDEIIKRNDKINKVRTIRNEFGSIIDRSFMGEDA